MYMPPKQTHLSDLKIVAHSHARIYKDLNKMTPIFDARGIKTLPPEIEPIEFENCQRMFISVISHSNPFT